MVRACSLTIYRVLYCSVGRGILSPLSCHATESSWAISLSAASGDIEHYPVSGAFRLSTWYLICVARAFHSEVVRLFVSAQQSLAKPVLFCTRPVYQSVHGSLEFVVPTITGTFVFRGSKYQSRNTGIDLCLPALSGSFGDCPDTRRKRKMLEEEGVRFENGKVGVSIW